VHTHTTHTCTHTYIPTYTHIILSSATPAPLHTHKHTYITHTHTYIYIPTYTHKHTLFCRKIHRRYLRAALLLRCRYAHVHTHTYVHRTHMHTHIHTNIYIHCSVGRCPAPLKGGAGTAVQVRTHTHTYIRTPHTHSHTHIPTHTHTIPSQDAPRHLRAVLALRCWYAQIHTDTYVHHTHMHTHIHTNIYTHYYIARCPAPLKGGAGTAVHLCTDTHRCIRTQHTHAHTHTYQHIHSLLSRKIHLLPHTLHVYISERDVYGNTKDEYIRHIHLRKRPMWEYTKRDLYTQKETKMKCQKRPIQTKRDQNIMRRIQ